MRQQVQPTSLQAFTHFRRADLGDAQREVLAALRVARRPVTGREIATHKNIEGAWKRLPELERSGLARRCGTRRCSVSGRNATAWVIVA